MIEYQKNCNVDILLLLLLLLLIVIIIIIIIIIITSSSCSSSSRKSIKIQALLACSLQKVLHLKLSKPETNINTEYNTIEKGPPFVAKTPAPKLTCFPTKDRKLEDLSFKLCSQNTVERLYYSVILTAFSSHFLFYFNETHYFHLSFQV